MPPVFGGPRRRIATIVKAFRSLRGAFLVLVPIAIGIGH